MSQPYNSMALLYGPLKTNAPSNEVQCDDCPFDDDILQTQPGPQTAEENGDSPDVNTPQSSEDGSPDLAAISTYLQNLTVEILELIGNKHDYDHPLFMQHLAPSMTYTSDSSTLSWPRQTREELVRSWKDVMACMPDFHVEVENVTCVVHPSGRRAHVWFHRRDLNWGNAFTKETVGCFHWEWRRVGWVVIKQRSMASVIGF